MGENNKTNNYTDFFYYAFRDILLVSIPLAIISALILGFCSPHSSANNSSLDNVAITIPSSCTLEGAVNSAHSASLVAGTYTTGIGTTTLKTYCNDANGFTIYAVGAGDNTTGNTNLVSSINRDYDIPTGLNTSKPAEGNDVSNWTMKLTAINGDYKPTILNNYDNYSLVPNTYTNVAYYPASTDTPNNATTTIGSSVTTTYAVYLANGQPAGTYTGQVKYAILHPYTNSDVVTLDLAYKRANKTKYILTTDSRRIPENSPEAETLEPEDIVGKYYTMQDMSTTICSNTNITGETSQIQLLDIRDNKTYWATKLDDGNCWMTQNLDLDLIVDTTAENYVALTSENTDLNLFGASGYDSANGYICSNTATTTNCTANGEIITWVPERSTITPENLSSDTWKNDNVNPYSYDRGLVYPDSSVTLANAGSHGLSGNYYNWPAAIASNNSGSYEAGDADNSVCPKGWRLPNTDNYEFSKLLYVYNVTKDALNSEGYATNGFSNIKAKPLYFISGDYIYNANITDRYNDGFYWSDTTFDKSNSFYLYLSVNGIQPAARTPFVHYGSSDKIYGGSLRCLAR